MPRLIPKFVAALVIAFTSACGDSNEAYFPLDTSVWRYYQTETRILDETKKQRIMAGIAEITKTEKGAVYVHRHVPDQDTFLQISGDSIYRLARRDRSRLTEIWDAAPIKLLPTEPSLGDSWIVPSELALIESRTFARQDRLRNRTIALDLSQEVTGLGELVTVPAGTFKNCLLVKSTGTVDVRTDRGNANAEVMITQQDWYARGVGLVKSERLEESASPFLKSGNYKQVLIAIGDQ